MGPLDQGTFEGNTIVCPLHRSAFDLKTGKLVGPWCPAPPLVGPLTGKLKSPRELQTFQARKQGDKVQVLLDVNAKKRFDANYWRGILDAQRPAIILTPRLGWYLTCGIERADPEIATRT